MPESQDGDSPRTDRLQTSRTFSIQSQSSLQIPKTKSAASLYALDTQQRNISGQYSKRGSIASIISASQEPMTGISPAVRDLDQGYAPTGLQRIRQQSPWQPPWQPPTSRATSATFGSPPSPRLTRNNTFDTLTTPSLGMGEDLVRFSTESIHSFSFSNKSDELIHARQGILKRSLEFFKDHLGWTGGNLNIATAQAKASGDPEMQHVVDLLEKANLINHSVPEWKDGFGPSGPLSGPAEMPSENPFEQAFQAKNDNESPQVRQKAEFSLGGDSASDPEPSSGIDITIEPPLKPIQHVSTEPTAEFESSRRVRRASLKRTFTDIAPLSLQSKLADTLAQPYVSTDNNIASPLGATGFFSGQPSAPNAHQPSHAHGRVGPSAQAIFTTELEEPWTTTAANDLACLIFGLSKGELRKMSILECFREDKRKWLEGRLKGTGSSSLPSRRGSPELRKSPSPSTASKLGNGITAKLLSKPPSRSTTQSPQPNPTGSAALSARPLAKLPSSGVILCGDVLPIRKRNGASGTVSLWVQEKRRNLIWVLEEIAVDTADVTVDEIGSVTKAVGSCEAIWGMERVNRGMDITRLLPGFPRVQGTNTGALDLDAIDRLKGFTAKTSNNISIPVTVEQLREQPTFRVSSFPHIAGMLVLSPSSLKVTSSNTVVCQTLFGRSPDGVHMSEVIPEFDSMIRLLEEEDDVEFIEGIVIPEQSFRRARALVALREGDSDAAGYFLRPSGLPALHRDGAEIMIDVQMRVVRSESLDQSFNTRTTEEDRSDSERSPVAAAELVYAVWVTYSRGIHAVNHGVGPISPRISRPGTPPMQPAPSESIDPISEESDLDTDTSRHNSGTLGASGGQLNRPAAAHETTESPSAVSKSEPHRKSISDFIILEDMGSGAYGQVKLARPKVPPTAAKVVMKYVTKRRILVDTWTRDRKLGTVPLEIHVLNYLRNNGLKHPNIIEMIDFFEDDINYYIEMPPHGLPGMDLFDYIELRTDMKEDECRQIFVQVASAVEFLHERAKVVHRDIKDENVILDGRGVVKLIDFGSAAYIKSGPFDFFVGTIDYAAPEVLLGVPYSGREQDVWALGILLYTIIYKENPFYSTDEIMDRALRVPYILSEESIDLVKSMLERDVERRIGIKDVLADRWCRGEEAKTGDVETTPEPEKIQ